MEQLKTTETIYKLKKRIKELELELEKLRKFIGGNV